MLIHTYTAFACLNTIFIKQLCFFLGLCAHAAAAAASAAAFSASVSKILVSRGSQGWSPWPSTSPPASPSPPGLQAAPSRPFRQTPTAPPSRVQARLLCNVQHRVLAKHDRLLLCHRQRLRRGSKVPICMMSLYEKCCATPNSCRRMRVAFGTLYLAYIVC